MMMDGSINAVMNVVLREQKRGLEHCTYVRTYRSQIAKVKFTCTYAKAVE